MMDKALLPSQQPTPMLNLLTFIITGLGGMGKTQLARDFANRNRSEFDVILFVIADQRQRLTQSYSEIARCLGLVEHGSTVDPENDRERLKLWFENPVKFANQITEAPVRQNGSNESKAKWLLILDNADDPQILSDFWPVSGFGSVLVTSRDPSTGIQHYPFSECLTLQGFSTEDAVQLLKTLTKSNNDRGEIDTSAKQIVQRLEGLPLAIDQISSIITRRRFSISDFARDYAQASDYHKLYDERHVKGGYEYSLGSVWAFESLETDEKGAFSLLCVLAMLDSACIQQEIMVRSLSHGAIDSYPRVSSAYNDFLAILIERSLVQRDLDDGSLTLHRLVQDVARARIVSRGELFKAAFEIAWKSVAASFPNRTEEMNTAGSVQRWQQCGMVYTHVVKLFQVARELYDTQKDVTFPLELIDLLYEAAWYVVPVISSQPPLIFISRWQCERREAAEALPLAELASTMCDLLAPNEEMVQKTRTPLQRRQTKIWACRIVIAQSTGDSKNAFHYSQLRYKSAEDEFEATGVLTGFLTSTCNTLGISYAMNRLHENALDYLTRSVNLRKQMPDFKKDWLYSPYYHMGITYHRMGDYEKAAGIIQEAIDDRVAALGPNDRISSRTAALYYSLGNIRNSEGRLDDAFGLHHRAYMQSRQTAGEFAFATLRCSQKLAEHYVRFGCDPEARYEL
ncbi:MAG: hypothetical protein OHK93_005909 [Ramalina farinacea]|uniref:DUF7779 domain-containing protein n=1 Tax=Ramalina farinacea TaxID=258253 RepID=A0AA43QZ71_9LECA|nr:hypothetical protein [Ramalina farinacea]